jgi:hypothetical protein
VKTGRYRHFKGNEYTVLGVARHSETQEEMVVYRQEYGDRSLWVRPLAMFQEMVTVEGNPASANQPGRRAEVFACPLVSDVQCPPGQA